MPASLPGATLAQNQANPTQGPAVIFDPLSGPKAGLFDARTIASWSLVNQAPVYANDPLNCSTGGLNTGIGFGSPPIIGAAAVNNLFPPGNFTDDYIAGADLPDGVTQSSYLLYIGGGRSNAQGVPNPFPVTSLGLCMAGNGGSRDGGTTPFTGFPIKTVTAIAAVANGADVEAGWANRSGIALAIGQSVFGSSGTALLDVP